MALNRTTNVWHVGWRLTYCMVEVDSAKTIPPSGGATERWHTTQWSDGHIEEASELGTASMCLECLAKLAAQRLAGGGEAIIHYDAEVLDEAVDRSDGT